MFQTRNKKKVTDVNQRPFQEKLIWHLPDNVQFHEVRTFRCGNYDIVQAGRYRASGGGREVPLYLLRCWMQCCNDITLRINNHYRSSSTSRIDGNRSRCRIRVRTHASRICIGYRCSNFAGTAGSNSAVSTFCRCNEQIGSVVAGVKGLELGAYFC